jgi:hypothetical protein
MHCTVDVPLWAEILQRLGTTAEIWQARLRKPGKGRPLGRFLPRLVKTNAAP